MTDQPDQAISPDVAEALRESAEAMRDVTSELRQLRPDVRRSVRTTRVAIAAVVVVFGCLMGAGWVAFDQYRSAACERGNATKEAVIDGTTTAAVVAVDATARRIAGPDPADQASAAEVADQVGADVRRAVAGDPKLAPRRC